jgi:hypothetical protein
MSTSRRGLLLGVAMLTAFSWSAVAVRAGGLAAVLPFVAPTALLAIGIAWLAFAFAGSRFPQLSALWTALVGGLTLSPIVALMYARSSGTTIGSAIMPIVAIAAGAAMSGAVWQIRQRAIAAFREWRGDGRGRRMIAMPDTSSPYELTLLALDRRRPEVR